MTNEKAKNMLVAKLICLTRETSGTDVECNSHNCENCGLNYEQGNMGEQKEALDMAIKAFEQQRWIPVSERLPEESLGSVLGWDRYRERCVFVQYIDNRFQITGKDETFDIVAWMPLPTPYVPDINVGEMGESEG